jgi:glycosyltransferase involved in cell wall biosynthesis
MVVMARPTIARRYATTRTQQTGDVGISGLPLRVCLLADTLKFDAGTEKLMAELARRLDPKRVEAHICCFEDSGRLQGLRPLVKTALFPLVRIYSPRGLLQIWRFRQYLKQHRIDIVHGFMNKASIFATLAAVGANCKVVITGRMNSGYWYTPKLVLLFRVADRFCSHILTNSAFAKAVTASVERCPPDKISVVYPGVDLSRYGAPAGDLSIADSLGIPRNARVVGIVANLRPVKDLPLFLKAARIVSLEVPDAVFLLVGRGQLRADLERLASELGMKEKVFFSGECGDVPDYLARMAIGCLTSESEGLPNAILEYMAAGLPVVATEVGGIPELVDHGKTGFLVRERSADAVAEPIIRLLRDEGLRTTMGQAGLSRARTDFEISVAVKRLEDFYINAVAQSRR